MGSCEPSPQLSRLQGRKRPAVFHDPRFLGDGFRERERIKRKSKRWQARFQRMSSAERQVVAAALAAVDRTSLEAASLEKGPR